MASNEELVCVYTARIPHDDEVAITGVKIPNFKAAKVYFEPCWPDLFAKALDGVDVKNLIISVSSGAGSGEVPLLLPGLSSSRSFKFYTRSRSQVRQGCLHARQVLLFPTTDYVLFNASKWSSSSRMSSSSSSTSRHLHRLLVAQHLKVVKPVRRMSGTSGEARRQQRKFYVAVVTDYSMRSYKTRNKRKSKLFSSCRIVILCSFFIFTTFYVVILVPAFPFQVYSFLSPAPPFFCIPLASARPCKTMERQKVHGPPQGLDTTQGMDVKGRLQQEMDTKIWTRQGMQACSFSLKEGCLPVDRQVCIKQRKPVRKLIYPSSQGKVRFLERRMDARA